jgi:hypothetical protein
MDTLYCLKYAWEELNAKGIDPTLEQVFDKAIEIRRELTS